MSTMTLSSSASGSGILHWQGGRTSLRWRPRWYLVTVVSPVRTTVRRADDGNGWTVMLDYRTLKTPAKRPLKLHSRTLAMGVAAECSM